MFSRPNWFILPLTTWVTLQYVIIKDIETVPQSKPKMGTFKAINWRIFIHQANTFMHRLLATNWRPTNAKFCQLAPDGQLLPWRTDHQPCWRGEQVFPWVGFFHCLRIWFFLKNWWESGKALDDLDSLQVGLAANWSWSKIYHLLQLLDNLDGFLIFHAQLLRYPYDLMTIVIIFLQVLGHIRQTSVGHRGKEPR